MHMNKMNKVLYEDYGTLVKAKIYGSYLKPEDLDVNRVNAYVMQFNNIDLIRKLIVTINKFEGISNIFNHDPFPKFYLDLICIIDPRYVDQIKQVNLRSLSVKASDTYQRENYLYKYVCDKELTARGYEHNQFILSQSYIGSADKIHYTKGECLNVEAWIDITLSEKER